jgi:hypothetical protein
MYCIIILGDNMNIYLRLTIEVLIVFTFVFLLNYFLFVRKNKKLKKDEMPLELIYLSGIYGIDPKKINFRRFQYTYSLLNAFIITTTYMLVTYFVKYALLKVIIAIVVLILLIIICYGLLGRYYMYKEDKSTKK